jgi:hypothetical protein
VLAEEHFPRLVWRQGSAAEAHEGLRAARAQGVEGAGGELPTAAGLGEQEHGQVGAGGFPDLGAGQLQGAIGADPDEARMGRNGGGQVGHG